jgi:hypothetical protein
MENDHEGPARVVRRVVEERLQRLEAPADVPRPTTGNGGPLEPVAGGPDESALDDAGRAGYFMFPQALSKLCGR